MRIVLDTNVLIAAFIARGVCHQLLEHCIRNHDLVTSQFILDEVREKLVEKFKYSSETVDEVVRLLRSQMEVVTPTSLDAPVCRDTDDDNVLATAATGNCACLLTGDKDLLVLKRFQDIDILSPSDFEEYEKASGL
ncbi:MAG TPA: putative toxin-antitoxin system toxin component, PIN family [Pyrinomonadaceae bacterium]